jgi:AcrR family transcriptional regulator
MTVAADLFRERGYRAATLDEIAQRVGVSKPTVYGYFRSKEELLAAIFHRTMSMFERDLAAIRTSGEDPPSQLRRIMRVHVGTVIAERSFLSVFFSEEANLPPALSRAIRRRKARYDHAVLAIVERGIRDGSLRRVNARLVVFALVGMANWLYQWYDPKGALDADAIAEAFITLAESGYLATKATRDRELGRALARIEAELARVSPVVPRAGRKDGTGRKRGGAKRRVRKRRRP